jgi:hypothetical protein
MGGLTSGFWFIIVCGLIGLHLKDRKYGKEKKKRCMKTSREEIRDEI